MIDKKQKKAVPTYEDAEVEAEWQKFFSETVKKEGKGRKKFKVSGSWGVYDAYKLIRKHKWYDIGKPVTEYEFYAIIRGINDIYAEEIAKGTTIIFPSCMGKLELKKEYRGAFLNKDDKLKITYPIDWKATLMLWFEDEEARNDKTLIRRNSKTQYRVHYNKYEAKYNNKIFYEFTLNRFIKQRLKNNILNGLIDSVYGKERPVYKYKEGLR